MNTLSAFQGLRFVVVGLGREGQALALYLARHGFPVTATDIQPPKKLGDVVASLAEAGVSLVLGEHPLSLLDEADLLFVSPGIPLEIPFLQAARSQGIPLSTETRLFCHLCPAPVVGITGSSGKTTTTTLTGKILQAQAEHSGSPRRIWVGGNIGRPLIEVVDQITADDLVVMELSSFQLEFFHPTLNETVPADRLSGALGDLLSGWSPAVSAILNITPNHLDRHPSMKEYVQAKRAIIDYQRPTDVMVMNLDDDMSRTIGRQYPARARWFSLESQLPGGAAIAGDTVALLDAQGNVQPVLPVAEVKLRGRHNLSNILAACLLSHAAGASIEAMREVISTFTGVEHRLEPVRELAGVRYINDSIATSPERLIAALNSFEEPIVLLAGGRDKHLPWNQAARLMLYKTRHVILFGEATEIIAAAVEQARQDISDAATTLHRCTNLEEAVRLASTVARPGDVVLLSPGCASFDAFKDFAERGRVFRELVSRL
ncbi:MAG: UDP-N-acetylmuramoyl-L-alanine--D-glutamate ligase [Chloroflexi bacterium]|nr:MAG: UDP-N-acetylmuramoyl-L-alanine--D-glutamate ligase [Chloroflexota bacterium]